MQVDSAQLILSGDPSLGKFRELGLDIAKLLDRFRPCILVDLLDLKLDFGDLPPRLGDLCDEHALLALQARRLPLDRGVLRHGIEIFLPQALGSLELEAH